MNPRFADALPEQYRLERELGAGGMATVYAARDMRHDRLVAIKVLHPDVRPATGAERFLREIRIAAHLTHPHILSLIDSGESRGFLFYVMPYIDGETIRERLARVGELPVGDSLGILRHMLDALAYAHGHGVVHRDIKPENVLLSGRHALVTDFGVAKALDDASSSTAATDLRTAVGTTVGTPAYMAPEQITGDAVDHRADIYAVGVVAYEMLTGHLPYPVASPGRMMAAHLAAAPDPIVKWRPTIPPRLANAVMKCLEKRPADRWQSAAELLAQVEAAGADESRTPVECNLCADTCFASRVLAAIAADRPDTSIAELSRFGATASSLDEWLNIHEYLVKVLRKFQGDIGWLQRAAADIVRPFTEAPGFDVFARWFRNARERGVALRLVFSNGSAVSAALARLKLENLDSGILAEEFPEAATTVLPNANHFELMAAEPLLRLIDDLVAETRARRRVSTAARPVAVRDPGTNPAG